jgi:hypothetical protein
VTRGGEENGRVHQHPGEGAFIGTAKIGDEGLGHPAIVAPLPDAVLPRQSLDAAFGAKEE